MLRCALAVYIIEGDAEAWCYGDSGSYGDDDGGEECHSSETWDRDGVHLTAVRKVVEMHLAGEADKTWCCQCADDEGYG